MKRHAPGVRHGLTFTLLLAPLAPAPCSAAPPDPMPSVLEEIVVTGTRTPRVVMDSSASISVLTRTQVERSLAPALADLLRSVPGVQVTDAGQPGLKRVRLRGEESRRTAILVDGQELTDHWEVGTPLSLDPAMVDRVEVLRGSGSVLYGPRALSGVVNFILRKGGDTPLQADVATAWDSATRGERLYASAYGGSGATAWRVAAARGDHGRRDTPDGRIPDTAFDNRSSYLYLAHRFGRQEIELVHDIYRSSSDVFVEESVRTSFPLIDFRIDVPQRDRERLAVAWRLEGNGGPLESASASAHRQWNAREFDTFSVTLLPGARPVRTDRTVHSAAHLVLDDALLQADWLPATDHQLVTGAQYTREHVKQDRHVDTLVNGSVASPEDIRDVATTDTLAVYALDTWQAGERLALEFGARHYWVEGALEHTSRAGLSPSERSDDALIYSAGVRYELGEHAVLRASAALGYMYPSLLQFATGAFAGSRFVNPAPDLDPERSRTGEIGVRVLSGGWALDAGLFVTRSRDYIDHVLCRPTDPCTSARDKIYTNIGESRAEGLELFAAFETGEWRPHLNLTIMRRRNEYAEFTTDDTGVPEVAGSIGVLFERRPAGILDYWCDVVVRGETGSRREEPASSGAAVLTRDDAWLSLDVSAGARYRDARIALELQNLSNERYSTSAENLLAPRRSITVRVDYTLDRQR